MSPGTRADARLAAFAASQERPPAAALAAAERTLEAVRARAADGAPAAAAWEEAMRPLLADGGLAASPAWAAYRTALAAELDGTDATALADPTPTIVAAAALAVAGDAGEAAVAAAVATGWELALRVGAVAADEQRERGWSPPLVNGALGAAVAAGRLLGCSPQQLAHALGLAATQAAGLQRPLGAGRASVAGKTAANGVEAALLARAGVTAAPEAIAGRRGLLALTAPHAASGPLTDALGERWYVEARA